MTIKPIFQLLYDAINSREDAENVGMFWDFNFSMMPLTVTRITTNKEPIKEFQFLYDAINRKYGLKTV